MKVWWLLAASLFAYVLCSCLHSKTRLLIVLYHVYTFAFIYIHNTSVNKKKCHSGIRLLLLLFSISGVDNFIYSGAVKKDSWCRPILDAHAVGGLDCLHVGSVRPLVMSLCILMTLISVLCV